MIVVTGGAGFIGSNIVRALNERGERDVIVVDDLSDGRKFANLAGLDIADYLDHEDFLATIAAGREPARHLRAILHQGACAVTTEWDGRYMMRNNFEYSKQLLNWCLGRHMPFIYASSGAVYGGTARFTEDPANERPLNVYGYSKLLLDQYVRRLLGHAESQVVGLRYFNVYGPGEAHKGPMASVAWHFNRQLDEHGEARLFAGSGGYADGEQRRDFVYVGDVADVNLWFLDHPGISGIYNVGTGTGRSFNDLANALIAARGAGTIRYIPFPAELEGSYQDFTEADLGALRAAGYDRPFADVEDGVRRYLAALSG